MHLCCIYEYMEILNLNPIENIPCYSIFETKFGISLYAQIITKPLLAQGYIESRSTFH